MKRSNLNSKSHTHSQLAYKILRKIAIAKLIKDEVEYEDQVFSDFTRESELASEIEKGINQTLLTK